MDCDTCTLTDSPCIELCHDCVEFPLPFCPVTNDYCEDCGGCGTIIEEPERILNDDPNDVPF